MESVFNPDGLRELLELPHVRQLQEARAALRQVGAGTGRYRIRAVYTAFRDFRALFLDSQRPKAIPTLHLHVQIDIQIALSDQIVGPHLGVDLSSQEALRTPSGGLRMLSGDGQETCLLYTSDAADE